MRMLDLFCGRFGWSRAFAARGWECVGVDLVKPLDIPSGIDLYIRDVFGLDASWIKWKRPDFICASSPCEEFSVHGMKHFHPNPKYPEMGIKLFNHTRAICEESGVPYIMENVRAAQAFVGQAVHHCGPFYLWGTGVPAILPQGFKKGLKFVGGGRYAKIADSPDKKQIIQEYQRSQVKQAGGSYSALTAKNATIPPELANCVADYAERILEATCSAH